MSPIRLSTTAAFLLLVFVFQESVVSKIHFPISGFSLYIATLMGVIALEDRSGAIVVGFLGGLILDLSPAIDSPFGQWAFVMTFMGFLFSINRETVTDFATRPGSTVFFVALASVVSLACFLVIGVLLGEKNGSFSQLVRIVLGNGFWTLLFAPIVLPLMAKFRSLSLTSRERI